MNGSPTSSGPSAPAYTPTALHGECQEAQLKAALDVEWAEVRGRRSRGREISGGERSSPFCIITPILICFKYQLLCRLNTYSDAF